MPHGEVCVRDFFAWSIILDHEVLKPLAHIKGNWDISWDEEARLYIPEDDSFAVA